MQGKQTIPNRGKHYVVSTGKVAVYANYDDGSSRLVASVDGERLLTLPRSCGSFSCVPDRKVDYEVVCMESQTRQETPDPTPVTVGIPLERPLTLQEEMKRFIREEISQAAEVAQAGSWEDEDDFDVDEDPSPISAYELDEMQEEELASNYDPDQGTAASADPDALPAEDQTDLASESVPEPEATPSP